MNKKSKVTIISLLVLGVIVLTGWYLHAHTISVLQPAGEIGIKERNLIIFGASLSLSIVIPVFALLFSFAWRYREGNKKTRYSPQLGGSKLAESIWWLVPTLLITIISVVNWHSSYALDPFKPIASSKATLHMQVVALDWKWLFIYPDQHVASVNYVYIPVGTPVDFEITSDSVMTSFWVPQLGGQMYAMPGMSTHLNLEATKAGHYHGVAANISGSGFADQTFTVGAVQPQLYSQTISSLRAGHKQLDAASYASLARPGVVSSPRYYSSVDSGLYDTIIMKYMMPMSGTGTNLSGVSM